MTPRETYAFVAALVIGYLLRAVTHRSYTGYLRRKAAKWAAQAHEYKTQRDKLALKMLKLRTYVDGLKERFPSNGQ